MNIVLTGMMGTGKTTVGKRLSDELNMQYIDTDALIEHKANMSINEIFASLGEQHFRNLEWETIKEVANQNNCVISTGGGVVKSLANMTELERNSLVVCLRADATVLYERLKGLDDRPLLKVADPLVELEKLIKSREVYYARCDLSINTNNMKIDEIVGKIKDFIDAKRN